MKFALILFAILAGTAHVFGADIPASTVTTTNTPLPFYIVWTANPPNEGVTNYVVMSTPADAQRWTTNGFTPNTNWKVDAPPLVPTIYNVAAIGYNGQGPPSTVTYNPITSPPANPSAPGGLMIVQSDLVINPSFASGFAGWIASGNVHPVLQPTALPPVSPHFAVYNSGQTTPNGTLRQLIPGTLAKVRYNLRFTVGTANFTSTLRNQNILVTVVGKTTLASATYTLSSINSTGAPNWSTKVMPFTADGPVTISFTDTSTTTDSVDLVLDDVQVVYSF